jgi:serine/threonine-protein kinase
LFTAAGFDIAQWQPVPPEWTTLAHWDARAAWTRTDPITGSLLRVEAAAWRGRPVFFRLIGDWSKPERMQDAAGNHTPWPVVVLIYLIFASACFIAWFNHKRGKGDKRGALVLAVLAFICLAGGRYLATPHAASVQEVETFWRVVAVGSINAGLAWVLYLALEPWVRRRWPHTMIGWSRYVAKGVRDPLVGRDLLIGTAAGALVAVASFVQIACHGASGTPNIPSFGALTGVLQAVYLIAQSVFNSLFTSILFFFFLFVPSLPGRLRRLVRLHPASLRPAGTDCHDCRAGRSRQRPLDRGSVGTQPGGSGAGGSRRCLRLPHRAGGPAHST